MGCPLDPNRVIIHTFNSGVHTGAVPRHSANGRAVRLKVQQQVALLQPADQEPPVPSLFITTEEERERERDRDRDRDRERLKEGKEEVKRGLARRRGLAQRGSLLMMAMGD